MHTRAMIANSRGVVLYLPEEWSVWGDYKSDLPWVYRMRSGASNNILYTYYNQHGAPEYIATFFRSRNGTYEYRYPPGHTEAYASMVQRLLWEWGTDPLV